MNTRRRFHNDQTRAVYDWYIKHRPDPEVERRSGVHGSFYHAGRTSPDGKTTAKPGTASYAAWAAGVDLALEVRKDQRGAQWRAPAHTMAGGRV